MRGADQQPDAQFSYVSPEQRVPREHPLRPIREMTNEALKRHHPTSANLPRRPKTVDKPQHLAVGINQGKCPRRGISDREAGTAEGRSRAAHLERLVPVEYLLRTTELLALRTRPRETRLRPLADLHPLLLGQRGHDGDDRILEHAFPASENNRRPSCRVSSS